MYQFDVRSILTQIAPAYFESLSCDTIEGQCGAMHGEDIFYFLGKLMMRKSFLFSDLATKTRIDLASRITLAFANFAKTGNPEIRNGIPFEEFDLENQKRTSVREVDFDNTVGRGTPDRVVEVDGMDRYDEYTALENIVKLREDDCEQKIKKTYRKQSFYGKAIAKKHEQISRKCKSDQNKISFGNITVCQQGSSITAYGIKYGNFKTRFKPAEKIETPKQLQNSPPCPS